MYRFKLVLSAALVMVGSVVSGCAVMELSGEMTYATGRLMTNYANTEATPGSFVQKAATFGGAINESVGAIVRDAAKSSN